MPAKKEVVDVDANTAKVLNALKVNESLLSRLTGTLQSWMNPGAMTLVQLFEKVGYVAVPSANDYLSMYAMNGMAALVVEAYSEYCWRELPVISEDKDKEETTPFEKAWSELAEEHDLLSIFATADIKAGLGYWGVIYLGFSDVKVQADLSNEVKKGSKLTHIHVFDYKHSQVMNWNNDPTDPRIGRPNVYTLLFEPEEGAVNKSTYNVNVHWSRCIHIPAGWKDTEISAHPRMRGCYNWLYDVMVVLAAGRIGYWNGGNPGVYGEIDKDAQFSPADMDNLAEKMQQYTEGLKRFVLGKGLKINTLSPNFEDPGVLFETIVKAIAATTKIPVRVLLGTEMGFLAGDQDSAKVASNITIRQRQYCEKYILRQFIDRMITYGILPKSDEKKRYRVEWSNLYSLSETEQANIGEIYTRALVAYANAPALQSIMSPVRYLMMLFNITFEEAEDIVEQAEDVEAMSIEEETAGEEGDLPEMEQEGELDPETDNPLDSEKESSTGEANPADDEANDGETEVKPTKK